MAPRKQQRLAVLRIGYAKYLLPAANAGKLVELLGEAIEVREDYDCSTGESTYKLEQQIKIEYALVRASQIRRAPGVEVEPIRLPNRLTKHAGVAGLLPAAQEPLWRRIKP